MYNDNKLYETKKTNLERRKIRELEGIIRNLDYYSYIVVQIQTNRNTYTLVIIQKVEKCSFWAPYS